MACRYRRSMLIAAAIAPWLFQAPQIGASEPTLVSFNHDIRPILSENCFFCHGPDAENREANLRLDQPPVAGATAIIAGSAGDSDLILRVESDDPDVVMPPAHSGRQLTDRQKSLLRQWIDQGGEYESHWSFAVPRRPSVPETPHSGGAPPMNPIDRFIDHHLSPRNLNRQHEASPETLIRRVTFDLTGLPPAPEEIDEFLADERPMAYGRWVDRLLASPRFGERMTADWLDVARYSDSYGMQVDRDRRVWPYRDWVIDAFNRGIGYDRFIIEQIAGDLLPDASTREVVATTFNRLHPQECEGGSVPEEFRTEYVADRAQTAATALLALTMECCRCHDHKYDPLTQREYYSFSSFFDNIDEAGLYSFFTDACPTPALPLPTESQRERLEALRLEVDGADQRLQELRSHHSRDFGDWLSRQAANTAPSHTQSMTHSPVTRGQISHYGFDADPPKGTVLVDGYNAMAIELNGDDGVTLDGGNFHRWEPFTVSLWLRVADRKDRAVVFHRSRAWTDAASRGYELLIVDGHLQASLIHFWPGNAVSVRDHDPLPLGRWVHVAMSWDGSSRASGLAIHVDGRGKTVDVVRDGLTKDITGGGGDQIMIGARFRDRGLTGGVVDEFSLWNRRLSDHEIAELFRPGSIQTAITRRLSAASDPILVGRDVDGLIDHYLTTQVPAITDQQQSLLAARRSLAELEEEVAEIMVMRELPEARQTYLLRRGAYDAPADPVDRDTPAVLPPLDPSEPPDRLTLARWMTRHDHPLVSRVAVNRLWQTVFGRGLVATPEDFGSQGSPPSHPDLLDWLAVEFSHHRWDIKRLMRMLVNSATYRQSIGPEHPHDVDNVYLGRAPRYRLAAEMLRDQALLVGGLLCETLGGEPAKPYEVAHSFKPVKPDTGRGLHRRSLYTYWNRTGPAPALTTLDASLRDVCRMKREATATPLQSLVMLNSPQFVEAARGVAERLVKTHGDDPIAIHRDLFRRLTSRQPTEEELALLHDLHTTQRQRFETHVDQATLWLGVGEYEVDASLNQALIAATASVALAMLNFDESVTKR